MLDAMGDKLPEGYQAKRHAWRTAEADHALVARQSAASAPSRLPRRTWGFGGSTRLSCPRCGLALAQRTQWLLVRHCPRCLARARTLVELHRSPPPAENIQQ